jgi:hypothetical protein
VGKEGETKMRQETKNILLKGGISFVAIMLLGGFYLAGKGELEIPFISGTATVPTCFDGVQNQGEEGVDCGGPCDACEEAPAVEPEVTEIQCPGTLETKLRMKVWDQLTEDAFDQVAVDYKVFDYYTGRYLSVAGTTNDTEITTEYVPCGKNLLVKYTDDDNTGSDIYPVTEHLFAQGAQVNSEAQAKVQGTIGVTIWDTTGTESDDAITMGTGQTYTQLKVKVQETEDGKAAQDIVLLFDYNTSQIRSISVVGATKLPGVPVCFNTYEAAFDTGVSLDSYGIATFDVVVKAMEGVDPDTTVTVKAVDKCGYYQTVDKQTFVEPVAGTVIGLCNDNNENVGIQTGNEGEDTLTIS